VLQSSPLYNEKFDQAWAAHDPEQANALLDEIGMKRDDKGMRQLPDGRPAELIVEFAGDSQEGDIVEIVREHWGALGLKVYARPYQLDMMRRRFLAGDTLISVWSGLSVGEATPDLPPEELAPVSGVQGNWPKWGEHTDSAGKAGEAVDLPAAKELLDLYRQWRVSETTEQRREIWEKMLAIFTDQVFTIGTVNSVRQPVVINAKLQNVPDEGVYTFAPSAYFGLYMPDTFWYQE
jgi:peptide/nickel transport system substrate-binding protein